jgi:hypothetical protein
MLHQILAAARGVQTAAKIPSTPERQGRRRNA